MSDKFHDKCGNRTRGLKRVCGRFKPNGSSAITNTQKSTVFGRGWTVAWTSTGKFTITIAGQYGYFLHGVATLMSSTITDGGQFRVNSVTFTGGNTVVVLDHFGEDAGGLTQLENIAAASDNFVTFELVFLDAREDR